MRILYPWERPERRILLWKNLPLLRKARWPRGDIAFGRLVDVLSSTAGRQRYRRLLRDLGGDMPFRRFVGAAQ